MREIKFRAWDYITKTMWQVEDLSWCDPCFIVANPGLDHMDIQDRDFRTKRVPFDIELMQYTGLKDKNGKEIHEGDIVNNEFNMRLEVFYHCNDERAGWAGRCCNRMIIGWFNAMKSEVIGNIYENPKLLKGK